MPTRSSPEQGQDHPRPRDHRPWTHNASTADISPGQSVKLKVVFKSGDKYDVFCPVPGHKMLGMNVNLKVSGYRHRRLEEHHQDHDRRRERRRELLRAHPGPRASW